MGDSPRVREPEPQQVSAVSAVTRLIGTSGDHNYSVDARLARKLAAVACLLYTSDAADE